jgi:DNA-damage-inducible protein D
MTSLQSSVFDFSPFDRIRHIDEHAKEFWSARELMEALGYMTWESFLKVLDRAKLAAINAGNVPEDDFRQVTKIVEAGATAKPREDYELTRYACYLVAQNASSTKKEVALAQTYFASQTRKQEIFEQLTEDQKRLELRRRVKDDNRKLMSAAKNAGVESTQFGIFNNEGYRGLYGTNLKDVEARKAIAKGKLLDHASREELAANDFRITQTDALLQKRVEAEGKIGAGQACKEHFTVGRTVRKAIEEIGGTPPEELPALEDIAKIERKHIKLAKAGVHLVLDAPPPADEDLPDL